VDPARQWQVTDADIRSKAGWTPFSGRTLVGRTVATFLRGELVMTEGKVVAEPGSGKFVMAGKLTQRSF
jgi:dihydroorotase-like cyclic amidohydrolase